MGKKRAKRKRSKPELRLRVMTMAELEEAVRRGEITGQPLPPELGGRLERMWREAERRRLGLAAEQYDAALVARVERLLGLLRLCEWIGHRHGGTVGEPYRCPVCGNCEQEGHHAACPLSAELGEAVTEGQTEPTDLTDQTDQMDLEVTWDEVFLQQVRSCIWGPHAWQFFRALAPSQGIPAAEWDDGSVPVEDAQS